MVQLNDTKLILWQEASSKSTEEDFCTSSLSYIRSNIIDNCSYSKVETLLDGCKKHLFEWRHFEEVYMQPPSFLVSSKKMS